MKELGLAVLRRHLPEYGLEAGDVGAIVHAHGEEAFEVEFVSGAGETLAVVTLGRDDVRPVEGKEILHVRSLGGS
jgi:hypothetical protein